MSIEETQDDSNLTPAQRAKKKMEEIQNAKNKIKTESTGGDEKLDIKQMEQDISNINLHRPLEGEVKILPEGEVVDATEVVIEEIDPDKIIPDVESPLEGKSKDRGYTKVASNATNPLEEEPIIPEPLITSQQINADTIITPPTEEVGGANGGTGTTPPPKPPPINADFGDMSPSEKRKNAEKTADVILANYAQLLPMLPKWLAKYDMGKMEMLEMKQEIRLSMYVTEDGTSIRDYMESENAKADATFVVTDAMKEDIKPALVDVLMEKGFAMTPMQRLLTALAGHVITFGVASFKMFMEHKQAINVFKEFKERERNGDKGDNNNNGGGNDNPNPQNPNPNPQNPSPNNETNNNSEEVAENVVKPVEITFHDVVQDEQSAIIIEETNDDSPKYEKK